NHFQITYYGFILIALFFITMFVDSLRNKWLTQYLKTFLILIPAVIIAVGMNLTVLLTSWEYSKETIRGPSELTHDNANQTSGLDKDYVVQWSEGIGETLTLLIPNFMGSSTSTGAPANGETYQLLRQHNIQNPRKVVNGIFMYHGEKPGTAGPYYFGAIVIFLFILGLFVVKGPIKWWLLSATVVSIVFSWGKHVMGLTSFLLDYLPLYNKFRAPEMTLVIAEIAMPLLGFWALNDIIAGKVDKKDFKKGFTWALALTGGISFLFFIAPGLAGNFTGPLDSNFPDWLMPGIIADRTAMLKTDAIRTFLFIALAAGLLYFWHLKKVNKMVLIIGLGFLILVDLWSVDKRYLNNDNFVTKRKAEVPFPMMPVDKAILKDKDLSYRVLPLQNPFQDARASYFHKSLGGYHAAKLRRYNEFIEHELIPEMGIMTKRLQASMSPDSAFAPLSGINMMNTRYIIYDLNSPPLVNPDALGNAWFVNSYRMVNNADEEIAALKNFKPADEAIVDKRFAKYIEGKTFQKDSNGSVTLTEYQPNYLKYSAKAASEQLVVFSEIYYDKGWDAFIDGKQVPYFRVDYVLRALVMSAGEHTIEFKFEPKSYYIGNKVSMASSLLLVVLLLGYGYSEFRKKKGSPEEKSNQK
ncbi:MAG TPA: YfhO family protein, partial [Draconibacterium sp.]|nr:YfhO family protein [Draconibacterium sp.]